jgi:hypothetical protein
MVMSAMSFARACGLTYLHTPFKAIAHADRPMREWVTAWENQFNLGDGELMVSSKDRDAVNFAYNFTDLIRWFGVSDLDQIFTNMVPEFRRKYYKNKAPRINDIPMIGVHIRRGDVSENHPAWTSTEAVLKTTSQAKSIFDARGIRCRVRVFSEGKEVDFSPFRRLGAELFLNVDAVWTMQELVESDVLIMAKSCFSFVAAMFCDGIKIYGPCGHRPLGDWVVCGPNGEFDIPEFERHLDELIQSNCWVDRAF